MAPLTLLSLANSGSNLYWLVQTLLLRVPIERIGLWKPYCWGYQLRELVRQNQTFEGTNWENWFVKTKLLRVPIERIGSSKPYFWGYQLRELVCQNPTFEGTNWENWFVKPYLWGYQSRELVRQTLLLRVPIALFCRNPTAKGTIEWIFKTLVARSKWGTWHITDQALLMRVWVE